VHLLDFDEDSAKITSQIYSHPEEIGFILASPKQKDLLLTCYSTCLETNSESSKCTIWRMDEGKLSRIVDCSANNPKQ
jgi:hypothetical protein